MILMGNSTVKIVIGVLFVSLALLVLVIAYRKLLAYLGRKNISKEDYCELQRLEKIPASGELEFYFSCSENKFVFFEILDEHYNLLKEIVAKDYTKGGHIVYFDSTTIPNGTYYYQLRTSNQKSYKRMEVVN